MRVITQPVRTFAQTLTSGLLVQSAVVMPNFGHLMGLWLDLTVTLAGATVSKASNSIDNVIQTLQIDDQFGKPCVIALGTDLSTLNDMLTPRGVRQAPPTITTDGGGAGSAEWHLFLPFSINAADMPGQVKLTLNALSALQNANLASAGTVTVTLVVRAAYSTDAQNTLRVAITTPPHAQGDNSFGPYLQAGFQLEALAFVAAGGDADFGYLTFIHHGVTIATQSPANDFADADTMLMQSGHLSGEFICRFPIIVVDSTTVMTVNLGTDTAVRLYSVSTIPQKRQ